MPYRERDTPPSRPSVAPPPLTGEDFGALNRRRSPPPPSRSPLLCRPTPFRAVAMFDLHAALGQRLAQQTFDLGVEATQIARRRPLDGRVERGVEAERIGFFGRGRHGVTTIAY